MKRLSLIARLVPAALLACGLSSNAKAWQDAAPPAPAPAAAEAVETPSSEQERLQQVMNMAVDMAHAELRSQVGLAQRAGLRIDPFDDAALQFGTDGARDGLGGF